MSTYTSNSLIGMALDFGSGNVKAMLVYPDRSEPVTLGDDSKVIQNAVFVDPADGSVTIGRSAAALGAAEPAHLAIEYKREIGENDEKKYFNGEGTAFDAAVKFMTKLNEVAQKQAGQTIPKLAIAAPAMRGDKYKHAIKEAAIRAGFTLFTERDGKGPLIAEPTAAMLASAAQKRAGSDGQSMLMVDLGNSTTDIVIATGAWNTMQVRAHDGDIQLGGQDIRNQLRALALEKAGMKPDEFAKLPPEIRFSFTLVIETSMRTLGTSSKSRFSVPTQGGSKLKVIEVSQREFNKQVMDPFIDAVLASVNRCVQTSGLSLDKLDHIQLVGGPSANPYLQERLAQAFGRPASCDVDPIMAIVKGVSIHAQALAERDSGGKGPFSILSFREIVPLSVGIAVQRGKEPPLCHVLFPKGAPAPSEAIQHFWLNEESPTAALIRLIQGEDGQLASDCQELARGHLIGLPLEQVRTERLEVKAVFDSAGVVRILVTDVISKKSIELSGKTDSGANHKAA